MKFTPWSELFANWHNWLDLNGGGALQACLSYPMSCPEVDRIVVGADRLVHLQEIVFAAKSAGAVVAPDLTCNDENLINPARWFCR